MKTLKRNKWSKIKRKTKRKKKNQSTKKRYHKKKKYSRKKKLNIKLGGSLSNSQMAELDQWKRNMRDKDRNKWNQSGLTFDEQYKSMKNTMRMDQLNEEDILNWNAKATYVKEQEIQQAQDDLNLKRNLFQRSLVDEKKDFSFLKNKYWLYPYLTYLMSSNPDLRDKKISDLIDPSVLILNKIFRPNTYIPNQPDLDPTSYKKLWLECTKHTAPYAQCRKSKGFNNWWVPKFLKYNPYVENIKHSNITINNQTYSLKDLCEMSYRFLKYEPKISELFRIIEAPHNIYISNNQANNLFTNIKYLDYCRDREYNENECDFVKNLITNNYTTEINNLYENYHNN